MYVTLYVCNDVPKGDFLSYCILLDTFIFVNFVYFFKLFLRFFDILYMIWYTKSNLLWTWKTGFFMELFHTELRNLWYETLLTDTLVIFSLYNFPPV